MAVTGFLAYFVCNAPTYLPHTDPDGPGLKHKSPNPFRGVGERKMLNDPLATRDKICAPEGQYHPTPPVRIEQPLPEPWGLDTLGKMLLVIGAGALICLQPEVIPFLAPAL